MRCWHPISNLCSRIGLISISQKCSVNARSNMPNSTLPELFWPSSTCTASRLKDLLRCCATSVLITILIVSLAKKQLIQLKSINRSGDNTGAGILLYIYTSSLHRRNSCSCLRAGALGQRLFSHLKEISASVTGQLSLSLSLALDTCDYVI